MKPPASWNGDRRHPTGTELPVDGVAVSQRGAEAGEKVGHDLVGVLLQQALEAGVLA